jgi:RNA polymerase sigma factor (sigma-70 family)
MSIIAEISPGLSVSSLEDPMTMALKQSVPDPAASEEAPDDFTLLRRFAGFGDPDAFAQIVRRYSSFVYATCLRVIGDGSRAEDLSQETFFRLMRRPHEVRQNLGGWLHRTATHLALDTLRSETSRRKREITYTTECDHEASTWAELSPCVDQALAEMPDESRMLLVNHFLLGKSQAQLAVEMNQSPSTISRRMHSALGELRSHLRLKGVFALPAALAGLLCHATARQAPASLVHELGKMAMLTGARATSRAAQFGSAHPRSNPAAPKISLVQAASPLILAFAAMVGMMILLYLAGTWFSSRPPVDPDTLPHLKVRPAAVMVVPGNGGLRTSLYISGQEAPSQ